MLPSLSLLPPSLPSLCPSVPREMLLLFQMPGGACAWYRASGVCACRAVSGSARQRQSFAQVYAALSSSVLPRKMPGLRVSCAKRVLTRAACATYLTPTRHHVAATKFRVLPPRLVPGTGNAQTVPACCGAAAKGSSLAECPAPACNVASAQAAGRFAGRVAQRVRQMMGSQSPPAPSAFMHNERQQQRVAAGLCLSQHFSAASSVSEPRVPAPRRSARPRLFYHHLLSGHATPAGTVPCSVSLGSSYL